MSGVATINLIPQSRRQARRTTARVTLWGAVLPVCCGLMLAAYLVQRFAATPDVRAVEDALADVQAKIKDDSKKIAKLAAEVREAKSRLSANRAVGEQPDWSLLLALLTDRLGNEAALTSLKLEPIVLAAKGKGEAEAAPGGGRPERLKLTISGVARSQAAASRFVLGLEDTPAFESVNLVEAKRTTGDDGGGTVAFQIACQLTDPGASGGSTAAAAEDKK